MLNVLNSGHNHMYWYNRPGIHYHTPTELSAWQCTNYVQKWFHQSHHGNYLWHLNKQGNIFFHHILRGKVSSERASNVMWQEYSLTASSAWKPPPWTSSPRSCRSRPPAPAAIPASRSAARPSAARCPGSSRSRPPRSASAAASPLSARRRQNRSFLFDDPRRTTFRNRQDVGYRYIYYSAGCSDQTLGIAGLRICAWVALLFFRWFIWITHVTCQ